MCLSLNPQLKVVFIGLSKGYLKKKKKKRLSLLKGFGGSSKYLLKVQLERPY